MRNEFIAFLKQYGVIGLAIAVIIGGKANALVTTLVDGILMPIITAFLPGGTWRTATLDVGPVHFLPAPCSAPRSTSSSWRGSSSCSARRS